MAQEWEVSLLWESVWSQSQKLCIILIHQDGYTLETASTELLGIREARFENLWLPLLKPADSWYIRIIERKFTAIKNMQVATPIFANLDGEEETFGIGLIEAMVNYLLIYILMNCGYVIKY